ncbi:hypothetical protein PG994_000749 [Apiospora phragmitis]|uniref:Alternative oxidase n=1 Tax=Apiospora phragmitis TaxID=2905665 RepID=A0ABR1X7C5_9PEZI
MRRPPVETLQSSSSSSLDQNTQPSSGLSTTAASASSSSSHQQQPGFELPHLAGLCRDTPWNPNLTLYCHSGCGADQLSLCGGLAEARNRVQTCLRLAIDVGAGGGLVIASIAARAAEIDDGFMVRTNSPTALFRTTAACRHDENEDGSTRENVEKEERRNVKTVNLPSRSYKAPHHSITTSSSSFSSASFRHLVEGFLHEASLSAEPVIVRYGDPYLAWDYGCSGEMGTLRRDLFQALRYNAALLALGRAVLNQIAEAAGTADGDRFIGVHLRGEGDWSEKGSGAVEAQMRGYVEAIRGIASSSSSTTSTLTASASPGDMKKRGIDGNDAATTLDDDDSEIRTVYVSCSDRADVQRFREMLEPLDYTVYDWRTLLNPPTGTSSSSSSDNNDNNNDHQQRHPGNETLLAQIEALGLDQRDVVEYEVLVRSQYWLGVSTSPMSTLIAYARGGDGAGNAEAQKQKENTDDWFEKYIYPHSTKSVVANGSAGRWEFARELVVRGDRFTKLLVVSSVDIMDYFP